MKRFKNSLVIVLITLSTVSYAGWPVGAIFLTKEKIKTGAVRHTSRIFAGQLGVRIPDTASEHNQSSGLNTSYITGTVKKEESRFMKILHWDFKMKFRLNRNMNIIFSYN